ncbi:MAG: YfdQ family protein [Polyangiaceae bacterium]|nr:YfdQ family protein [Polyangiaceae bacterium]
MDNTNTKKPVTEADAVASIVERNIAKPLPLSAVGPSAIVLSEGLRIESMKEFFDEYLAKPERRKGTANFDDLDSFIAHAKRFADTGSAIFADRGLLRTPRLTSVIDYHWAGHEKDTDPRFGGHRGIYSFPLSTEWTAWKEADGKALDQAAFASFLEDRLLDVVGDPSNASSSAKAFADALNVTFAPAWRLLELSRGLSVRVGSSVRNAQNLQTGEVQVNFVTEHQDETGGPLKVPSAFIVAIPVFRQGDKYEIPARLRYRIKDGKISWFYELHGVDKVFDHAFREACTKAQTETNLPLFFGTPEA